MPQQREPGVVTRVAEIRDHGVDAGGIELALQPIDVAEQGHQFLHAPRRTQVIAEPAPGVGVRQASRVGPGSQQAPVGIGRARAEAGGEIGAHDIVQPHRSRAQVEYHQRSVVKPAEHLFRLELVEPPQFAHDADGHRHVLGKDGEFLAAATVRLAQEFQAHAHGRGDGLVAVRRPRPVESGDAAPVQRLVHVVERAGQAVAAVDALAHGRSHQRQQQRPFAQALRQAQQRRAIARPLSDAREQQRRRLGRGHLVHAYPLRVGRDLGLPRRDQARAAGAAAQERLQMRRVPHVVDHDQAVPVLEFFRQRLRGVLHADEARPLSGQRGIQPRQFPLDVGRLAESGPKDAVVEREHDVIVVTEGRGQRGLAEAAGAGQSRRDRATRRGRFQQQGAHGGKRLLPDDVVLRQIGRHEGDALDPAAAAQVREKGLPLHVEVVHVRLGHPARQPRIGEIEARTLDRIDAHPALASGPPFLARDLGLDHRRRHDDHQELDPLQRCLDLPPPAHAALDFRTVLPHSNVRLPRATAFPAMRRRTLRRPCGHRR